MKVLTSGLIAASSILFATLPVAAQESNIKVQCPSSTALHPTGAGIKCGHLVARPAPIIRAG